MSDKLLLTTQATADVEKKFAVFKKNLKAWFKGMRGAAAQALGYRVLIGQELNQAKEVLTHGEFEKYVEEEYGLAKSTQQRWREFSVLFLSELDKLPQKSHGVGLLSKKSKSAVETIMTLAPIVLDGKGEIEFMRDIKLLREPQSSGGNRNPNPTDSRQKTAAQEVQEAIAMIEEYRLQLESMANDTENFVKALGAAEGRMKIEALGVARVVLGTHLDTIRKANKSK